MACTDCYAIGSAKGLRAVGGFAGQVYDSGNVFTRCYAAGALDCTGTYAGAFVGYPRRYGAVTDCRVQFAGVRAAGTSAAGDSAAFDGVTELDSAGMHARSNFAPYHALDPQVWAQIDGATHPYFTWSLSDGRMSLLGATAGASGGAVAGAGWHEPGATVTIRAVESDTAVFVGWTGTTPYANPGAATTTVVLDNFRTVTARFSKLVSTATTSRATSPSARTSTSPPSTAAGRPSETTPRRSPAPSTARATRSRASASTPARATRASSAWSRTRRSRTSISKASP